ncbi:MAG: PSD1 and planctomycete cytochrome C domain-containing protein [Pirellulaceae bacterium]
MHPRFLRRVAENEVIRFMNCKSIIRDHARYKVSIACCVAVRLLLATPSVSGGDEVDFNRDVRPILSGNCFACHGFDENARQANLRLDTREGATADVGGYAAIAPGDPDASELLNRVLETDPDLVMPPPSSHKKPLTPREVNVLRRWIEQGAPWGKHWSFEPPVQHEADRKQIAESGVHPIDYFVQQRFADGEATIQSDPPIQLRFAPQAATHTLARRLSFDLTGLPPTPQEVAPLGENPSDPQWDAWIDRLLESPHFGERMAMWWLDGARYSDTDGFQQDATRTNWPWRDWVIDAFNNNMPFDQFTIHQFAGDLLPDATDTTRLATCFHRNHMHNGEGGRDPEESRVDYVLDRTNTIGTVWLGLTLGCTQCHDHKFDPISQQDYYSLTAYFDSIDENGQAGGNAGPFLTVRSEKAKSAVDEAADLVGQAKRDVAAVETAAKSEFAVFLDERIADASQGFVSWHPVTPAEMKSVEGTSLTLEADQMIRSGNDPKVQDEFRITVGDTGLHRITGLRLEVFADDAHSEGKYSYAESGEFILTNVKLQVRSESTTEVIDVPLVRAVANVEGEGEDKKYGKVSGTLDDDPRTGWTTRTQAVADTHTAVFELAEPLRLTNDQRLDIVLMQRSLAPRELIGRFRLSLSDQRGDAVRKLDKMPMRELADAIQQHRGVGTSDLSGLPFTRDEVGEPLREALFRQFLEDHAPYQAVAERKRLADAQLRAAKQATGDLKVTVLKQRDEPRKTHVLIRGVWDAHGEQVSPSVLSAVLPRDGESVPSRLELAQWIVDPKNPLTARVIVNQIWQQLFGAGLVRTPADFGQQGEMPTHPRLLDWLAVDFMRSGWDLKHLLRRIVTSRTYRQESAVSASLLSVDPENRWLARGARFRLPSWMIRDGLLKVSGLINPTVGGPPVFPYQPPGVWKDQFMGRFSYTPSIGEAQYRRTVYAFWRRSSAPTFLFDTAMRRTCEVAVRRTNTPLQALTLMNDLTSLEASRKLADSFADLDSVEKRLSALFEAVLTRTPRDQEADVLLQQYAAACDYYRDHLAEAERFLRVGQLTSTSPQGDVADRAALMLTASMILNLDESITHE